MKMGSVHPTPVRLRDRLREETTRAILEAAEAVFAEDGLHAARMEAIASRAGVAVGTLYNHFADRGALLAALAQTRREAMLSALDRALEESASRPIAEQLRAFLDALLAHARTHGRFLSALVEAGEGPARVRPTSLLDELLVRAERVVARGIASGELRRDDAGLFPAALVAISRSLVVLALAGRATFDAAPAVIDLFLRGARA